MLSIVADAILSADDVAKRLVFEWQSAVGNGGGGGGGFAKLFGLSAEKAAATALLAAALRNAGTAAAAAAAAASASKKAGGASDDGDGVEIPGRAVVVDELVLSRRRVDAAISPSPITPAG